MNRKKGQNIIESRLGFLPEVVNGPTATNKLVSESNVGVIVVDVIADFFVEAIRFEARKDFPEGFVPCIKTVWPGKKEYRGS